MKVGSLGFILIREDGLGEKEDEFVSRAEKDNGVMSRREGREKKFAKTVSSGCSTSPYRAPCDSRSFV